MSGTKHNYSKVLVDSHVMSQAISCFANLVTSLTRQLQPLDMSGFDVVSYIAQLAGGFSTLLTLPQGNVLIAHRFADIALNKGLKV
jgi:hypothetical protein